MEIIPLSECKHFDYVSISGEDASSFLQGQVTCNMDLLSPERSLHGALCNLKGRVIADFRLFQLKPGEILLQTLRGNGQNIVDTLSRYAVFSKVEIAPNNGPKACFGVIGTAASAAFQEVLGGFPESVNGIHNDENFLLLHLPGPTSRYQLWCHHEEALAAVGKLDVLEELASIDSWNLADIRAGIVHINSQTSENYTPQLVNYDISGVVDFEKGCYTGQEVVARMHYRAKAKKRLFRLVSDGSLGVDSTICVADEGEQSVAEIMSLALSGDDSKSSEALAIMSTELAAENPELAVLGKPAQQVALAPLPYMGD